MRTIKFRAWDNTRKKMFFPELLSFDGNDAIVCEHQQDGYSQYRPTPTLMQFTGLLDRHGKEVYEGDVVRSRPPKNTYSPCKAAVVRWDEQIMCFEAATDAEGVHLPGGWDGAEIPRYWEVIGNVWENPGLLTV